MTGNQQREGIGGQGVANSSRGVFPMQLSRQLLIGSRFTPRNAGCRKQDLPLEIGTLREIDNVWRENDMLDFCRCQVFCDSIDFHAGYVSRIGKESFDLILHAAAGLPDQDASNFRQSVDFPPENRRDPEFANIG